MKTLTIITINYNNAAGLQKTVDSVLSQTSQDFEYIVVDGDAPQPPKGGVLRDLEVIEGFVKEKAKTVNGFTACSWLSPFGGVGGGFYSGHLQCYEQRHTDG
ncbi:MAG: glycosyltransferase [Paludibacter sp.]|nr:glycosyltransferase [Paludibacter sp.]